MLRPSRAVHLEVDEADDGLLVYDNRRGRLHRLNHTAALVFELCDGSRTVADLARAVRTAWPSSPDPEREVASVVDRLVDDGVLQA